MVYLWDIDDVWRAQSQNLATGLDRTLFLSKQQEAMKQQTFAKRAHVEMNAEVSCSSRSTRIVQENLSTHYLTSVLYRQGTKNSAMHLQVLAVNVYSRREKNKCWTNAWKNDGHTTHLNLQNKQKNAKQGSNTKPEVYPFAVHPTRENLQQVSGSFQSFPSKLFLKCLHRTRRKHDGCLSVPSFIDSDSVEMASITSDLIRTSSEHGLFSWSQCQKLLPVRKDERFG